MPETPNHQKWPPAQKYTLLVAGIFLCLLPVIGPSLSVSMRHLAAVAATGVILAVAVFLLVAKSGGGRA